MEKLRTATGKEFDCDYFNTFTPASQANIRIVNVALYDVAITFSDPKETVQLWFADQYLALYTKLIAIIPEAGAIRIVLGRE